MNTHAHLEEDFLPVADDSKTAATGDFSAATGTFSLRRALYLNKAEQLPEHLPSDSRVVLPFENTNHSRADTTPTLTPKSRPNK